VESRAVAPFTVADLQPFDDEPRVKDIRLGERAGLSRARDIRPVIENNADELLRYGSLQVQTATSHDGRGAREVQEYWFNEGQTLLLFTKLNTDVAADARQEIITVFMARRPPGHYRAGPGNHWLARALSTASTRTSAMMRTRPRPCRPAPVHSGGACRTCRRHG
jgi:hypothetical protein